MNPLDWIDEELAALKRADLLRELPAPLGVCGPVVELQGRQVVSFASNDYLGLAGDARLTAAAAAACQRDGVGRGASPLVSGRSHFHDELERRLAQFEDAEAAILFPSGYAANTGAVAALAQPADAIFADERNHASLIDGCRLSRAEVHVYPHADVLALADLLKSCTAQGAARRRLIVTDSVFSMDGDVAPLAAIADLAIQYEAMLLVDEAHATGVLGPRGRGAAETLGHQAGLVRVGTLSKALGSAGGFVCGSRSLTQWLANRARSYVFSTAQPAAAAGAALGALDIVDAEPDRRIRVLAAADRVRAELKGRGWNTGASTSQIVPVLVGDPGEAVALSRRLREQGFWVPAIRPPSVPEGQALLRISLTAAHTPKMIAGLLAAMGEA
jgi:8-amino-7-oxononanoate synthase